MITTYEWGTMDESKPVGIDLGTTRTVIGTVVNQEPELLENMEGSELTPSVVRVDENGDAIVGQEALNAAAQYPNQTVSEIKREMGTESAVTLDGEEFLPEQISALILEKVVRDAEERLDRDVSEAVITVPAYFGERERSATKSAAGIAGIEPQQLLNEPSAACLAYGFKKEQLGEGGEELTFVYDLGGGTFDVSLVEVDYDINYYETSNTNGRNDLGGKDWTDAIVDWIVDRARAETDQDPSDDRQVIERIRDAARDAKHSLSSKDSAQINIPFLLEGYNFEAELTREQFDEMTEELLEQTREPIDELFESAEASPSDVDTILLIGGSSRMQQVHEFVEQYFDAQPSQAVSPDRAVAIGAAIATGEDIKTGKDDGDGPGIGEPDIIDVVPKTLGVELDDGRMSPVIETDETLPVETRKEQYSTIRDDQTRVEFPIREGEADMAAENDFIGKVVLGKNDPIPPRDPDKTSLAVTFILTKDGTLEVTAEDLLSNRTIDAVFEGVGSHSGAKIAEMQSNLPSVKQ